MALTVKVRLESAGSDVDVLKGNWIQALQWVVNWKESRGKSAVMESQ